MVIGIILGSLALLTAAANTILILYEKKRSQERNTALMQYADTGRRDLASQVKAYKEHADAGWSELAEKVSKLEKGMMPDYEKARDAAQAVNSFHDGITGILGFDPMEALKRQRERDRGGESE